MRGRLVAPLALAAVLSAGPAAAQIIIVSSSPESGARLDEAPEEVSLDVDRDLSARSSLSVLRCGKRATEGPRRISGERMAITLAARGPGLYEVRYRLVAAEGGGARRDSFVFTVGDGPEACERGNEPPGIWDIPLDDFAVALAIAALIGAAGGHVYAGIVRPRP